MDPHFLDLGTSWRWVVSFTPLPLYPRGKSHRYPLDRLGGPQSRSERKFLSLPGLELRSLGRPARSQSLYRLCYPGSHTLGTFLSFTLCPRIKTSRESYFTTGGLPSISSSRRQASWDSRPVFFNWTLTAKCTYRTSSMIAKIVPFYNIYNSSVSPDFVRQIMPIWVKRVLVSPILYSVVKTATALRNHRPNAYRCWHRKMLGT
jgi:hypothetical protein